MVVMIYNWETKQTFDFFVPATQHEVTHTIEMNCVKLIHNEKIKIYVLMQRYSEPNA